MNCLSRLGVVLLCVALPALAADAPRVLVVPYQGLGLEGDELGRLTTALRAELSAKQWALTDAGEAARQQRSAVMCGEDVDCLATLGQRSGAKWVLAFGAARIGSSISVGALFVDASSGRKHQDFLEKVTALPADLSPLARRAVEALLRDVPVAPALTPDVPPPPPPLVEQPAPSTHPLRPYAITATVVTGVAGAAAGVFGVMAMQHHGQLAEVPVSQRAAADAKQRTLNTGADASLAVAVAAAGTATVLWLFDLSSGGQP